jgi:hypothetical protein
VPTDGVAAGAARGFLRSIIFIKMKSILKIASLKSFRPGKQSMFSELRASAQRREVCTPSHLESMLR